MIITFAYISYKNLHLLALCIIKTNKNSVFVYNFVNMQSMIIREACF